MNASFLFHWVGKGSHVSDSSREFGMTGGWDVLISEC